MTVRPISKPMIHHDPESEDDRTRWVCDVHGVVENPTGHDACTPAKRPKS